MSWQTYQLWVSAPSMVFCSVDWWVRKGVTQNTCERGDTLGRGRGIPKKHTIPISTCFIFHYFIPLITLLGFFLRFHSRRRLPCRLRLWLLLVHHGVLRGRRGGEPHGCQIGGAAVWIERRPLGGGDGTEQPGPDSLWSWEWVGKNINLWHWNFLSNRHSEEYSRGLWPSPLLVRPAVLAGKNWPQGGLHSIWALRGVVEHKLVLSLKILANVDSHIPKFYKIMACLEGLISLGTLKVANFV